MEEKKARQDKYKSLMNTEDVTTARNAKASVFTDLFSIPKYGLEMLKTLHPEMELTENDLVIVTLKNILANLPYNDLGILAGDRLMILAEAQSTYSVNILPRILIYMAYSYKNYIAAHEQDAYSTSKVKLPKPECYVIYTGEKSVPEVIRFSQEFFDGEETGVEITATVITDDTAGDIISQYISFSRIFDEQVRKYGRTKRAAQETVRYCVKNNILREYLNRRGEMEVVDLMMLLFDDETIMKNHDATIRREAYARGEADGMAKGEKKGKAEGKAEGTLETLIALVKQGKITARDAAEQAGESEEAFARRL